MIAQTLEPRCPALEAEDRCFQKLEVCDIADLDALFGRGAECTPLGMRPFSATVRVLRTPLLFVGEVRSRSAYQVRTQVEAGRMCLAYADSKPGFSVRPRSSLCRADIVVAGEGSLDVRMRGPSQLVWIEANVSVFPQLPALVPPAGDVAVVRPTEPALSMGLRRVRSGASRNVRGGLCPAGRSCASRAHRERSRHAHGACAHLECRDASPE